MAFSIDQVYRDFETDGVPSSDAHEPIKSEIRALLKQIEAGSGMSVTRGTLAQLNLVTPPSEDYMGIVLTGTGAGYYYRSGSAWVFGRAFPDSVAFLTQTGGSGNALQLSSVAGVSPSTVVLGVFVPEFDNAGGGVTVQVSGSPPVDLLNASGAPLAAGELQAGTAVLMINFTTSWRAYPIASGSGGFTYRGAWSGATNYIANDIVQSGGSIWMALQPNLNVTPIEGVNWTLWLPGVSVADESVDAAKLQRADRLDMLAKLGVEMKQPNMVEKLCSMVSLRGRYIRPWISGGNTVGFYVGYGMAKDYESVSEFRMLINPDNLLLSAGGVVGVEDATQQGIQPTLIGTFNTGSAPTSYATVVGDQISTGSLEFGGDVFFNSPTDANGGMWEFSFAGQKTRVSVWSASLVANRRIRIFRDIPYGIYPAGIVGEFLGDDTEHPPTGTSRGYLTYQAASTTNKAFHLGKVKQPSALANALFSTASVPDFAISARPANQPGYTPRWVPEHAGVSGVSGSVNFKLIVDGRTVTSTAGLLTALASYMEFSETVQVVQAFNALHPSGGGTMWTHIVTHTFERDRPVMVIDNALIFSQDTYVSEGYIAMMPSDTDFADRLTLNNGVVISPVPADGSTSSFGFDVSGAMYSGEYSETAGNYHAMAMQVSSLREAANLSGRTQPAVPGLLDFRASTVTKVYFKLCDTGTTFLAGERLTCRHEIALVGGIRSPNILAGVI